MEFNETNSEFYDLEYFISLEYRYFSGAHSSRIRNIFAGVGNLEGLRVLDVGSGNGYLTYLLRQHGADVLGVNFQQMSAYNISSLGESTFDLVTIFDVIEHLGDHNTFFREVRRVLKPSGHLAISTDAHDSPWNSGLLKKVIKASQVLSADGRAYRIIKRVEDYRRKKIKDYHESHIAEQGFFELEQTLTNNGFLILEHRVYPLVGVPLRDVLFSVLPKRYRGDCQLIIATQKE